MQQNENDNERSLPDDGRLISVAQARRIVALADDLEQMERERESIREEIARLEAALAQARRVGDDWFAPTAIAGLSDALPPRRMGAEHVTGFSDEDVPVAAGFADHDAEEGGAA